MRKLEGFPLRDLEEMRDSLYGDIEKGYDWIEGKETKGEDTQEAEVYWADLLRNYESVNEEIRHKIGEGESLTEYGATKGAQ